MKIPSSVKSLAARKAHLDARGTRLLAGEANQLFPSAVFSSFKFPASPESTSSMSVGPNPDYMPLWVQKRYGGAAMAGLQIREKCITQQSQSTASSANPPPRFTVEAASAFPILLVPFCDTSACYIDGGVVNNFPLSKRLYDLKHL